MYGKTTSAHHFMERTGSHATKGSRRGFVDVETGVDPTALLTPAQRRDSLKRQHAAIGRLRADLKSGKVRGSKEEWERLGRDMQAIQDELSQLNKLIVPDRSAMSFDAHFAFCARAMLVPREYERIAEAARRRQVECAARSATQDREGQANG